MNGTQQYPFSKLEFIDNFTDVFIAAHKEAIHAVGGSRDVNEPCDAVVLMQNHIKYLNVNEKYANPQLVENGQARERISETKGFFNIRNRNSQKIKTN